MPTLLLTIDARKAKDGSIQFSAATTRVEKSAKGASGQVDRMNKSIKGLGATAGGAKRMVVGLLGGLTGFLIVRRIVGVMGEFEKTMVTVRGITGATADEMVRMTDVARELGATTQFSAREAGEGLLFLSRAGFSANEAITALPATLNLAAAGGLALGQAADFASNILSQFSLVAGETERVVDVLVHTANSANTNVQQLAEAMKFAGPVAGALGISIEETAAAIGVLGDAGIQASLAGTNLRGTFAGLLGVTTRGRIALEQMGISMEEINPERHDLITIFEKFRDANISASQAVALFGRRNAASALVMANSIEKMKQLREENEKVRGEAKRLAEEQMETLIGRFKGFISVIQETMIASGGAGFLGLLKNLVTGTTSVIRAMINLDGAFVNASSGIRVLATLARIALISLGAFAGLKLALLFLGVAKAIGAAAIALVGFNTALATNPVGLVAIGVGLLVAGLIELLDKTEKTTQAIRDYNAAVGQANQTSQGARENQVALAKAQEAAAQGFENEGQKMENMRKQAELLNRAVADSEAKIKKLQAILEDKGEQLIVKEELRGLLVPEDIELLAAETATRYVDALKKQIREEIKGGARIGGVSGFFAVDPESLRQAPLESGEAFRRKQEQATARLEQVAGEEATRRISEGEVPPSEGFVGISKAIEALKQDALEGKEAVSGLNKELDRIAAGEAFKIDLSQIRERLAAQKELVPLTVQEREILKARNQVEKLANSVRERGLKLTDDQIEKEKERVTQLVQAVQLERSRVADKKVIAGLKDELSLIRLSNGAREIEIQLRKLSGDATVGQKVAVTQLVQELQKERALQAKEKATENLEKFVKGLEEQAKALAKSNKQREIDAALRRAEQIAIQGGIDLLSQEFELIRKRTVMAVQAQQAQEKQNKAVEDATRLAEQREQQRTRELSQLGLLNRADQDKLQRIIELARAGKITAEDLRNAPEEVRRLIGRSDTAKELFRPQIEENARRILGEDAGPRPGVGEEAPRPIVVRNERTLKVEFVDKVELNNNVQLDADESLIEQMSEALRGQLEELFQQFETAMTTLVRENLEEQLTQNGIGAND